MMTLEKNIYRTIGSDGPRVDAWEKVTGAAQYTTDIQRPGMLHAKLLRSNIAHGKLVSIDATKARRAPGVHAVLTRDELDRVNSPVYGYFIKDQPIVAIDKVRYIGDTLAAVAAETEAEAEAALALIEVELEPVETVADLDSALAGGAPELFEDAPLGIVPKYGTGASGALRPIPNACYVFNYTTGEADAFEACDHVFEDSFEFSRMHHLHLEPFVTVAETRGDHTEIWTSGQNPFPLRKEIGRIFGISENRITVNTPYIGGGFGAKNNCKTEPIAILLSQLARRPVRLCLTVEEGFLTNTQHAARLILKTGVMNDGRFVARESVIYLDSGAYSDASPLVAEKAGYRIPGPYKWDYINTDCYCMMTNTAPAGPFRGFGGTQSTWAGESQIDMIAHRLDIDPLEIRRKNLLKLGEPFVPGESAMDSDLEAGMDLVNELAPEHLEILTAEPFQQLNAVRHAGAIFLGPYTPEPVGDYFAGPNHTIPTGGRAKYASPLSVQDFIKKSSVISYSRQRLEKEGPAIRQFAEREELFAHAEAIRVRGDGN